MAEDRPNIILIMADDMGWDLTSFGGEINQTPELDALAMQGMRFTDFHSNGGVCSPTRAAVMTGKYQQRVGIHSVILAKHYRHVGLELKENTVAEMMKGAGYKTGLFGKWHLGYDVKHNPVHQGFDEFKGFIAGNVDYISHVDIALKLDWWDGNVIKNEEGYTSDLIADYTVDFIDRNHDEPFFVVMAQEAPHDPFQSRDSPIQRIAEERVITEKIAGDTEAKDVIFPKMMKAMDEGVGRVVDALEKYDIADNTLIVFMSDNGPNPAGRRGESGNMTGRKGDITEGGHRVPAFAYWPAKIKPGLKNDTTLLGMDLMPTFANLAGIPAKKVGPLDGVNFSDILLSKTPDVAPRDTFWMIKTSTAIRSGPWKVIMTEMEDKDTEYSLFKLNDLGEGETEDIKGSHPDIYTDLKSRLLTWDTDMKKVLRQKQIDIGFDRTSEIPRN